MKPRDRIALPIAILVLAALTAAGLYLRGARSASTAANPGDAPEASSSSNGAISPQDQADALHFVIAEDRELYCREFIAHMREGGSPQGLSNGGAAGESWPLPEDMFREAAESIQSKGAENSYALRSLHPIDPRDGPQTDLEQVGLAFVAGHPGQNYYGQEMLGGRHYFTAVYPDLPAAAACIDCHARRSPSNPQRGRPGDILGGVVVRVPLEF